MSAAGDAEINEGIALPSPCVAPIVLVRVTVIEGSAVGLPPGPVALEDLGITPPWIAASGF